MSRFILALFAAGVLALTVLAQEPSKLAGEATKDAVHRLTWEHADKDCQFIDKGDDVWVEVDRVGKPAFEFKETRRNCDFVELNDKSRGVTVRLYKDAMFLKNGPMEDYMKFYDGKWVK